MGLQSKYDVSSILETLTSLNPWWRGTIPDAGIPREKYLPRLMKYLDTGEIVVLSGVRRSGKTTLLHQTIRELLVTHKIAPQKILFVNGDDPAIGKLTDPVETILDTYRKDVSNDEGAYLFFDEIQALDGWEQQIRSLHDNKAHHIIITGSSSVLLESQLSVKLSGRYLPIPVFPLDFPEYLTFRNVPLPQDTLHLISQKYQIITMLRDYFREGGFPRVVLEQDKSVKTEMLASYYDSIVYRDIVISNTVRNVKALRDLLVYLFSNISCEYSYRSLSDIVQIDLATTREYLHYAGQAHVLYEVPFFSYSVKTQNRNNRKCYCIDGGLRNAISLRFSEDTGRLAENLVFVTLLSRGFEPYYWKGEGEVDFVCRNRDTTLTAINVSYTDDPAGRETRALILFRETFGDAVDKILILTKDLEKTEGDIVFLPLWKWLLQDAVSTRANGDPT
ncbi:MAG: ATP-binding protein [Methanoregula sp.]|nr:ATP-binding protein [Methanoregula sp.]